MYSEIKSLATEVDSCSNVCFMWPLAECPNLRLPLSMECRWKVSYFFVVLFSSSSVSHASPSKVTDGSGTGILILFQTPLCKKVK